MSAIHGYRMGSAGIEGQILCARQFQNSLDESSLEEVKAAIRSLSWLEAYYEIGEKYIRSRDGRINYAFTGLERNLNSIKSKARILLCWVDEAEPVTDEAWTKLIPTVREDESEVWVTWNPERKGSATDERFLQNAPLQSKIVQMNWRDNPWLPEVLRVERENDLAFRPDECDHIWEGGYRKAHKGAYFADGLSKAEREGRVGEINPDPLLEIRTYWDIGGTSAKSDATAIWVVQFVGQKVNVLDYYEAVGQPLSAHVGWLRDNGYTGVAVLPHDGTKNDMVFPVSYQTELNKAGISTVVVPNQGAGAATQRIEAVRRVLDQCWFTPRTEKGRDALAWYHEKWDEARGIGLGPEHDFSSHASDAFGLMALAYLNNNAASNWSKPLKRGLKGVV